MFANTCLAYDALSDGMKAMMAPMRVVFSSALKSEGGRAANQALRGAMTATNMDKADAFEAEHPLVRTHPETGRKGLYLNTHHGERFAYMTEEESRPLFTYLCDHIARPEFTCRFRWTPRMTHVKSSGSCCAVRLSVSSQNACPSGCRLYSTIE